MAKSTLHLILTNPFYAGLSSFKGECFAGQHEALVSRSLFEQVQQQLRLRRK